MWFGFDLGDFYWNRLSYAGFSYDPEMVSTLALVQDVPFTFLDCGANYGYWSVLMGARAFGKHRSEALNCAVTRRSDDRIAFY
jgi:hypothetical protein